MNEFGSTPPAPESMSQPADRKVGSDRVFISTFIGLSALYILLIAAMLIADAGFVTLDDFKSALASREIRYAIKLSLISCTLTAILSLWIAIPIGYLMSRYPFPGKNLMDAILDIPIVLPPLVIGLSLLILFQTGLGQSLEQLFQFLALEIFGIRTGITYQVPAVILAQFMVACAFAVRTMRTTFDQINPRQEQVARTLGGTRSQAFWMVVLPQARRGVLTAGTLAWSRALGEFGPILVFAGATRMHTEVLPTTIFLELSIGNIEAAVAVSMLMVLAALVVLVVVRMFGNQPIARHWGDLK